MECVVKVSKISVSIFSVKLDESYKINDWKSVFGADGCGESNGIGLSRTARLEDELCRNRFLSNTFC